MYTLYLFESPDSISDRLYENIAEILPDVLREKCGRYKNLSDRKRSAVAYFIAFDKLSELIGKVPEIAFSEHGKPYVKGAENIYFNISHCPRACVCVVSDCEVGIDIQDIREVSSRTVEKVCRENELEAIRCSEDKNAAFARIWAMKESFIKMTGDGLSYGLKNVDTTRLEKTDVFEKYGCFIAITEK